MLREPCTPPIVVVDNQPDFIVFYFLENSSILFSRSASPSREQSSAAKSRVSSNGIIRGSALVTRNPSVYLIKSNPLRAYRLPTRLLPPRRVACCFPRTFAFPNRNAHPSVTDLLGPSESSRFQRRGFTSFFSSDLSTRSIDPCFPGSVENAVGGHRDTTPGK